MKSASDGTSRRCARRRRKNQSTRTSDASGEQHTRLRGAQGDVHRRMPRARKSPSTRCSRSVGAPVTVWTSGMPRARQNRGTRSRSSRTRFRTAITSLARHAAQDLRRSRRRRGRSARPRAAARSRLVSGGARFRRRDARGAGGRLPSTTPARRGSDTRTTTPRGGRSPRNVRTDWTRSVPALELRGAEERADAQHLRAAAGQRERSPELARERPHVHLVEVRQARRTRAPSRRVARPRTSDRSSSARPSGPSIAKRPPGGGRGARSPPRTGGSSADRGARRAASRSP